MEKEIEKMKKLIKEELDKKDSQFFQAEMYYDYTDIEGLKSFFGEIIKKDKNTPKTKDEFIDELENELINSGWDWISDTGYQHTRYQIESVFDEISKRDDILKGRTFEILGDDFIDEMDEEYFSEYGVDLKIEEMLQKMELDINIIPMQDVNLDTECDELDYILEEINKGNFENREVKNCKILNELFKSQGYEIKDLADDKKVESSKFLKSFIAEMLNSYEKSCLIFCYKISASDYLDIFLKETKDFTIKESGEREIKTSSGYEKIPDTSIGLFDPVFGGGSLLEIFLEKPFHIKTDEVEIQFEDFNYGYGYLVESVYGRLDRKNLI